MLASVLARLLLVATLLGGVAHADAVLTDLVLEDPADARTAIAIGPSGEVFAPEKGTWVRRTPIAIAHRVTVVGRADGVVALAGGAVYRLAENGWSALRLTQKGKAVMSGGARAVAVVGKQMFSLDRNVKGEPAKLPAAPGGVTAIGAGPTAIVIATDKGLQRLAPGKGWKPIAKAPKRVERLIDDQRAVVERGVVALDTGVITAWPGGFRLGAVTAVPLGTRALAELGLRGRGRDTVAIVAAGAVRGSPTLVVMAGGEVVTEPMGAATGTPVGVAVDRAGRVVVALAEGTIAVRDTTKAWSSVAVTVDLPAARPGAPPATGPR